MNSMYDYVIRKEFVGNLVYNVKEDDITLADDISRSEEHTSELQSH